ncbi:unnamed protein product [Ascophyllum nodosum]
MANPRMFEFVGEEEEASELCDNPAEFNTCVFKLEVKHPASFEDMPDPLPKGTSMPPAPAHHERLQRRDGVVSARRSGRALRAGWRAETRA